MEVCYVSFDADDSMSSVFEKDYDIHYTPGMCVISLIQEIFDLFCFCIFLQKGDFILILSFFVYLCFENTSDHIRLVFFSFSFVLFCAVSIFVCLIFFVCFFGFFCVTMNDKNYTCELIRIRIRCFAPLCIN